MSVCVSAHTFLCVRLRLRQYFLRMGERERETEVAFWYLLLCVSETVCVCVHICVHVSVPVCVHICVHVYFCVCMSVSHIPFTVCVSEVETG